MAQLKDSVINGNLIVTDSTLTDSLQVTTVIAPTASGSYEYGTGEDGQALRSNGTTTYWGNLPTYQGMTESEIDAGTSTYNRTISPKNLKYAVREYETANSDNMMQLYYNGYTTMNVLDCYGISSATQKTSFDLEFNNEVLAGTYEFAAYIVTLSSVTSCTVTFYNSDNSSVGTCQLTTNSASAHTTVNLSDITVKMTLSFASSTTISIDSFGLFPKFMWDYAYEQGFIVNMAQPSLPTPLITQKLNDLRSNYDDVKGENVFVGTCTSAANSQTKAVTVSSDQNFELKTGVQIAVKFSASNTYSATTSAPCKLNVNSTGAYNIWWTNTGTPTGTNTTAFGTANYYHYYTFDGTYWVWTGYSNHSNTTYSGMTVAEINAGTSTTNRLISPANLKTAVETYSPAYTKAEIDVIVDRLDTLDTKQTQALEHLINSGAKNRLEFNASNRTHNGITFTVSDDGTVTANGTATANAYIQVASVPGDSELFDGTYRLCGCPTGGSRETYAQYAALSNYARYDYGESVSLIPTGLTGNVGIVLMIYAGYTANNVIFKPMICKASDYLITPEYVQYCPTLHELYEDTQQIEKNTAALTNIIDTGAKNLVNASSGSGTRFVNIPIVLQPGQYHVYFGTITTTDTDSTTCQCAAFASDNTDASNYLQLQRIDGSNGLLTVTQTTSYVRLYASNNYANGNGDTVTFTDCMICKESDWQISQEYVPYCPTDAELYAMQYVHDSVQVNLNDVTWTQSGGGLYYSNTITIPNSPIVRTYHATLSGFGNLRATDVITPAVRRSGSWSGFVLYANTNSFLSSAWITVSVSGLPN